MSLGRRYNPIDCLMVYRLVGRGILLLFPTFSTNIIAVQSCQRARGGAL